MADSKRKSSSDGQSAAQPQPEEGFGDKSIGFWGSVCLLANNITGPGMVQIPVLFQQAGWLVPTIAFGWVGLMAGLTSLYLAKAVSMVPGNGRLQLRMEFGNLARMLFPRWLYLLTFAALIFNFQVSNMSSIVVSAQTMDETILAVAKKDCALVLYNPDRGAANASTFSAGPGWSCVSSDDDNVVTDSLFDNAYVISLGYMVTMAITIPLGYLNLDDNIWVQYGGFLLLLMCTIGWAAQFLFVSGLETSRMPAVVGSGLGSVLPTVIFNWGFLTTLPSWLNEKSPSVSVSRATWVSVVISGVMFLSLGLLGGLALDYPGGEDLLTALNDPSTPKVLLFSKVCCFIFPSAALLSGIPVFSIIIRYNLLENRICNKFWANLFAVVFPWAVSLIFFPGNTLATLINWSSAILFVALNFVLPLQLYLAVNSETGRRRLCEALKADGMLTEDSLLPADGADGGRRGRGDEEASLNGPGPGASSSASAWLPSLLTGGKAVAGEENVHRRLLEDSSAGAGTLFTAAAGRLGTGADLSSVTAEDLDFRGADDVSELPGWWPRCCGERSALTTASAWWWLSAAIALACLVLQVVFSADPNASGGGGN